MSCNDKLFPCSQEVLLSFLGHCVSLPCGKLRQEGWKPAAFLERGPSPFGKQPRNCRLCRGVWRGCVGRESTRQLVTFAMAEVQGRCHAGGCLMRAFLRVCRCFVPWRSSPTLRQPWVRRWLGHGGAQQRVPVHGRCCLALLICRAKQLKIS